MQMAQAGGVVSAPGTWRPDPELDTILRGRLIDPLFQPIVDLADRAVIGVESLARGPAGSALEFPDQLFAAARAAGRLGELDMLCAERTLESAIAAAVVPPLVFGNSEPSVLDQPLSPRLLELLLGGLPFPMVLEFTERALATVPAAMLRIADQTRALGNCLALDDVGAEPMSLAFLPLIEPEVIKLDMHLLRHPHAPSTVEVCSIVRVVARRTGAVVIAEGIETEADLHTARSLGATWGQGWLFGRPAPLAALSSRFTDVTDRRPTPRTDLAAGRVHGHDRIRPAAPPVAGGGGAGGPQFHRRRSAVPARLRGRPGRLRALRRPGDGRRDRPRPVRPAGLTRFPGLTSLG
ncbi:EAL domain-containing protein [Micromonosporaceae bacterium Da 78-11]